MAALSVFRMIRDISISSDIFVHPPEIVWWSDLTPRTLFALGTILDLTLSVLKFTR
jgi:hypothetical protein